MPRVPAVKIRKNYFHKKTNKLVEAGRRAFTPVPSTRKETKRSSSRGCRFASSAWTAKMVPGKHKINDSRQKIVTRFLYRPRFGEITVFFVFSGLFDHTCSTSRTLEIFVVSLPSRSLCPSAVVIVCRGNIKHNKRNETHGWRGQHDFSGSGPAVPAREATAIDWQEAAQ